MKKAPAKIILVVEDEPTICQVCHRVLTHEGFKVDIAVNAAIAKQILDMKKYDLCLIDIRTPAMNGDELYDWLKGKHPSQAKQVIFTTGDVLNIDTQKLIERSARPLLPKPFTPDELKSMVKAALGM